MASSPGTITKALTLRGAQYNHCILEGHKTIENRSWRIAPGWYALHTGAGKSDAATQQRLRLLVPSVPDEASLPKGVIVGAINISHSLTEAECASSPWATGPICNVVAETVALPRPVPHKGALGLWNIDASVLAELQVALAAAPTRSNAAANTSLPGPRSLLQRCGPKALAGGHKRQRSCAPPPPAPSAASGVAAVASPSAQDLAAMGFAPAAVKASLHEADGDTAAALELLLTDAKEPLRPTSASAPLHVSSSSISSSAAP